MPESVASDLPELFRWQAETLRLTLFPTPQPYSIESSWWQKLVGEPPEKTVNQPRDGIIREEGTAFDSKLLLIIQPTRIDWVLSAAEPPQLLGELPKFVELFLPLVRKWVMEDCPPAQRIAFGLTGRLEVTDKATGYQTLSRYLPSVSIDSENSSDFLFQINRPRTSRTGIEGLRINRLARWSVGFLQQATFSMSNGVASSVLQQSQFYCRAELDINTAADLIGEFDRTQIDAIVQELSEMGLEIFSRGDIA